MLGNKQPYTFEYPQPALKYFRRVKKSFAVFPAIRLSGKWLQQAGFNSGQIVEVSLEQNKLIITIAENEEPVSKVKKRASKQ